MSSDISSTSRSSDSVGISSKAGRISADDVASYLRANPDFFADRDNLLADMTVPHASGKAISLLERQVQILRDRSIESRHTLNTLLENARYNDQLFGVTRNLILTLLEEDEFSQLACVAEVNLATQPGIDACRLIRVDTNDRATELQNRFPSVFRSKRVLCQILDKETSQILFPGHSQLSRSAALCPVTYNNSLLAILAIGNQAQDYFNDNLDTLFLDFIAEVLGSLIVRLNR
jgi:uncharacterized protein